MAERQSAAGTKGYKRLCDVIVLVHIVHVNSDDRERYSGIRTHQTKGALGAAAFIINCTNLWLSIRVIMCSREADAPPLGPDMQIFPKNGGWTLFLPSGMHNECTKAL